MTTGPNEDHDESDDSDESDDAEQPAGGDPAPGADEDAGTMDLDTLLRLLEQGDQAARDAVVQFMYDDLKRRAKDQMRGQPKGWTLQPTDLVSELYLKLLNSKKHTFENKAHFLSFCSRAMRNTLVDYARRKQARKRGGDRARKGFEGALAGEGVIFAHHEERYAMIDLHEALDALALIRPGAAQIVEFKFFGKLTNVQIAEVMDKSTSWVERKFMLAKAWLRKRLG